MNCSGKHAAMLLTCQTNGWSIDDYRSPDHPLQQSISNTIADLAGEPIAAIGVDGCGAPLLALSLVGLARSVQAIVDPKQDGRVAEAMRAHPVLVGGSRRPVTHAMRAVPGLVMKEGAEGVLVLALPDGRAAALKVLDGADRARIVAGAALLIALGIDESSVADQRTLPVLGGGAAVGAIRSPIA